MDIYGIIYKVTNLINNKVYIGQTIRTLEQRKNRHILDSNGDLDYLFYRAIKKYGIDNFSWDIIDYGYSRDDLNNKEVYWIDYYKSYYKMNESNGYNMTIGGESLNGEHNPFYGRKHSDKSKKIMSENAKGRIVAEEVREKISKTYSERYSGENSHMYGKAHSEETKKKMSKSHKGIKKSDKHRESIKNAQLGGNNSNAKKVVQLSLDGDFIAEFDTIIDASNNVSGHSTHIINCCKGRLKSSSGFIWIYKDEYSEENVAKKVSDYKEGSTSKKPIYQLDNNGEIVGEYESVSDGASAVGADRSALAKCCKDQTKRCKGFRWIYKKDYSNNNI